MPVLFDAYAVTDYVDYNRQAKLVSNNNLIIIIYIVIIILFSNNNFLEILRIKHANR